MALDAAGETVWVTYGGNVIAFSVALLKMPRGVSHRLPLDAPYICRGVQVHYCSPPRPCKIRHFAPGSPL